MFGNQEKVWLTWISNMKFTQEGIIILISNLQGYCSIYTSEGQFLGNIELNETLRLLEPITLLEIISSTGLQIKSDPGIPVIYLGFFFLMLSTLVSYITYSQIWLMEIKEKVILGGKSNRAVLFFQEEFRRLVKRTVNSFN